MNKYAALGLLFEAAHGLRITVVVPSHVAISRAVDEFEVPDDAGWRVSRANGDARITSPAHGVIRFAVTGDRHLPKVNDIVFLDVDADRGLTPEALHALQASLKPGEDAGIVRA